MLTRACPWSQDMDAIYTMMGVCPQHDLLWDTLTGREHLLFYGRLKGLQGEWLPMDLVWHWLHIHSAVLAASALYMLDV